LFLIISSHAEELDGHDLHLASVAIDTIRHDRYRWAPT
jgi:hypothetical protein